MAVQNLIQLQSDLQNPAVTIQHLMEYANGSNPEVPSYMALAELSRRKQLEQTAQAAQAGPMPTVKQQVEQGLGSLAAVNPLASPNKVNPIAPPQTVHPEQPTQETNPTAKLPEVNPTDKQSEENPLQQPKGLEALAGGGIVAFDEGGETSDDDTSTDDGMTAEERAEHEDALARLAEQTVGTGDQYAENKQLFPAGTLTDVKPKDYRDTVQPYGGLHDNSLEVLTSAGKYLGDLIDSLSPSAAALAKKNIKRDQPTPVSESIVSRQGKITSAANTDQPSGKGFEAAEPATPSPAEAASAAPAVPAEPPRKAITRKEVAEAQLHSMNDADKGQIVAGSLSDLAKQVGGDSIFSRDQNVSIAPDVQPAEEATPAAAPAATDNLLAKYGIEAPTAKQSLEDIRKQQIAERQAFGIAENPTSKSEELMQKMQERWDTQHKSEGFDQLIAMLGGIAGADPSKGFAGASSAGISAATNLAKVQQAARDQQEKAALDFWSANDKEKDLRARGFYTEAKEQQVLQQKAQYEYAKASQTEQEVGAKLQEAATGAANAQTNAARVKQEGAHQKFQENVEFPAQQLNKKEELKISQQRANTDDRMANIHEQNNKLQAQVRQDNLTEKNLNNYAARKNGDKELQDIYKSVEGLDLSNPSDYETYRSKMARKFEIEQRYAKEFNVEPPDLSIQPPLPRTVKGGWFSNDTMDYDPLLKKYVSGTPSQPQAPAPSGIPKGWTVKQN